MQKSMQAETNFHKENLTHQEGNRCIAEEIKIKIQDRNDCKKTLQWIEEEEEEEQF